MSKRAGLVLGGHCRAEARAEVHAEVRANVFAEVREEGGWVSGGCW